MFFLLFFLPKLHKMIQLIFRFLMDLHTFISVNECGEHKVLRLPELRFIHLMISKYLVCNEQPIKMCAVAYTRAFGYERRNKWKRWIQTEYISGTARHIFQSHDQRAHKDFAAFIASSQKKTRTKGIIWWLWNKKKRIPSTGVFGFIYLYLVPLWELWQEITLNWLSST